MSEVYCSEGNKAIVTIHYPEKPSLIVTLKNPPITIEILEVPKDSDYIIYAHSMNAPIDKSFENPVIDVQLDTSAGDDWIFSTEYPPSNPIVHKQCPRLDYSPINDNIHIDEKRIYSNFDTFYGDNSGTCTYKIYFKHYKLKITDASNVVFEKIYNVRPRYAVSCGEGCPPGWCKIDIDNYPGYCCINSEDIREEFREMRNKVRSIRGE